MTGTSTNTPTTVARAAPDWKPNNTMAVATASSKKLLAPIKADAGDHQATPQPSVQPVGEACVEIDLDDDGHCEHGDNHRLADDFLALQTEQ